MCESLESCYKEEIVTSNISPAFLNLILHATSFGGSVEYCHKIGILKDLFSPDLVILYLLPHFFVWTKVLRKGHIPVTLCLKTSPRAKPFYENEFHLNENEHVGRGTHFHMFGHRDKRQLGNCQLYYYFRSIQGSLRDHD